MDAWTLKFEGYDPNKEKLRESLCTLGNGFFATRGAAEDHCAGPTHYPGTYLAGGYNRLRSVIAGKEIENEDLVNWPNWLFLQFRIDGEWIGPEKTHLISYDQELDLRKGVLYRKIRFKDPKGRESVVESRRFVSMDNAHVGALEWIMTPVNWSGDVEIKSGIDCGITNSGVERYKNLSNKHLITDEPQWPQSGVTQVNCMSSQSQLRVCQTLRTEVFNEAGNSLFVNRPFRENDVVGLLFQGHAEKHRPLRVVKTLTLFTSRDRACSEPSYEALRLLNRLPLFERMLETHAKEWARLWKLCDIELPGRLAETKLLRFHIFHLLQTVSLKTLDLDVGVPARGLHGEAYRGHIFWDELFIIPFLNLRIPELSRALLMYRYRRLTEARVNAQAKGFKGAMFPWQSGSNGEEESQEMHLNPVSGHWVNDVTSFQRHVNGAIIYNIWHYYQSTRDREFLSHYGMEIALDICRFFASALSFNPKKDRYEMLHVMGPDEFHSHDPESGEAGINNNAYTNYLVSWCFRITNDLFHTLPEDRQIEILRTLELSGGELTVWQQMGKKIFLPIEDGIILPFEAAKKLKELDWESYRKKYKNLERLDRILEAEGDSVNKFHVNKQADVLMLFFLFSPQELAHGFSWMGYDLNAGSIEKNINYHLNVSTHGSTLSRIVHAWVLARYDSSRSWKLFENALETDVSDLQGGTTAEGIHLGAMAGTVDIVQRCFTGIEVSKDQLSITPSFPCEMNALKTVIHFRGHALSLSIQNGILEISVKHSHLASIKLEVSGTIYELKQGDHVRIELKECPIIKKVS